MDDHFHAGVLQPNESQDHHGEPAAGCNMAEMAEHEGHTHCPKVVDDRHIHGLASSGWMDLASVPEGRHVSDHIHRDHFDEALREFDGSALEDKDARSAHRTLQDMTSCGREDFEKNRVTAAGAEPRLDHSSEHRASVDHESVLMVDSR